MNFDRGKYFDAVRGPLFGGKLTQQQVDGQNAILDEWVQGYSEKDLRWLAYALATTKHETASTMWPIEEYGKGKGMSYGTKDKETGQTYYGRGYVQLTWRENYAKATKELSLTGTSDDMEWNASRALNENIAADVMFEGMIEGWFRKDSKGKQTLARYFNDSTDDPYGAREIINGDKKTVPSWADGKSIGNLIADYHKTFLKALNSSVIAVPEPEPEPAPEPEEKVVTIDVHVDAPAGVKVVFNIKGTGV